MDLTLSPSEERIAQLVAEHLDRREHLREHRARTATRRGYNRVVTIAPGASWPESEGVANLPPFAWVHLANRGAAGSGNDLWVSYSSPLGQMEKPDRVLYAGSSITENVAGPSDPLAEGIHLRNVGTAAVDVVVKLAREPLHYLADSLSPSGSVVDVSDRPGRLVGVVAIGNPDGAFPLTGMSWAAGDGEAPSALPVLAAMWMWNGVTAVKLRTPSKFLPQNGVSLAAEATIWTPAAGKKFRLMGFEITSDVAGNVVLRDNTAGTIIDVIPCAAGVPVTSGNRGIGQLSAAANNVLTATGPAASHLSGTIYGTEE